MDNNYICYSIISDVNFHEFSSYLSHQLYIPVMDQIASFACVYFLEIVVENMQEKKITQSPSRESCEFFFFCKRDA